ncbi:uncharacterized protein LOC120404676, partial [Mauremys reevesii]|uniref:uncharacterized protein LOC120404676 n=1 Tax=Mauremys reevesii TaxID=260615 RepID=UPI00193FD1E4
RFKNSPTLFGQALAKDLEEWNTPDGILLLQYVDDLLIGAVGLTPCLHATVSLLNFVGLRGYRVAQSKAQIALSEVQYLGFHIRQGERQLSNERKGVALGVLTQLLGIWKRPVAYFSKQLDQVAKGWPACLRAVAATALVLGEAEKLTLGGTVQVYTPHMVQALLDTKCGLWLTQARVARYQAKLLENPEVTLQTCPSLNPATMLPETEEQEHDCLEIIDAQYSSRPDSDMPLECYMLM